MSAPDRVALRVRRARLLVAALLLVLALPAIAAAQTQARVTADRVTIWRPGFIVVAATANTGDVFEVLRRVGNWYEVVLPSPPGQPRATGFIAVTRAQVIGGGAVPDSAPPAPPTAPSAGGQTRASGQRPAAATRAANRSAFRLVGQGGYGWFSADKTFEAVTGSSGGPWFGGGLRYDSAHHYFIEGTVERYQATGERVFVFEDTVYKLGIDNKVTITPLMVTGGYSIRAGRSTAYVGGGIGAYMLREVADFTEDSENVDETSLAYRVVAGSIWPLGRYVAAGVEFQFNTVPNALEGGTAAAFDESNLGGISIVGKLLFGRN